MAQRQREEETPGTTRPREIREAPPSPQPGAHGKRTRNILIAVVLVVIVLLVLLVRRHTAASAKQAQAAAAGAENRAPPPGLPPAVAHDVPGFLHGLRHRNA